MTTTPHRPDQLDIRSFAKNNTSLKGTLLLSKVERLAQDLYRQDADFDQKSVYWEARGESIPEPGAGEQVWLHLSVHGSVPLQCQRCLQALTYEISLDRSFRFVRDEAQAAEQDEDAEEDLLVISKQFNVLELIEDELIMALPFSPLHDVCPVSVKLQSSSDDFESALSQKPNAFAALGELKSVLKKVQP